MTKNYRISFLAWTVVLILLPFALYNEYARHLAVMSLIYAIMSQGLNLVLGYTGSLSLGQAALYALGGYTSALCMQYLNFNFWPALLAAVLIVALIGLLVGAVSLRVRGAAFIIMTITFSSIIHLILLNWVDLTNGQMGIARIPGPSIFGFAIESKLAYYFFVLAFVIIVQFICGRLINSRTGRAFIAVKEDESLAASLGISPFHFSLLAFVIGSACTGLSGALYGSYIRFISPEMGSFNLVMLPLLMMTVLGGRGTLWGPVLGAFIFTVLPEYLRIAEQLRMPIFGFLLILMVLFIPNGLLPTFTSLIKKMRMKKQKNIQEVAKND